MEEFLRQSTAVSKFLEPVHINRQWEITVFLNMLSLGGHVGGWSLVLRHLKGAPSEMYQHVPSRGGWEHHIVWFHFQW